ncbi:MmgE/PrpD family protein (plasmid) [Rhizobium ruizarguesonis]|uniref:MmgE/PrpD family protein n=1 Tax=Rhizobium ruizarguesonis TaxID=2081791 RepID=UPI001031CC37|nr:MmgE/PrpD family protein [Rhizobium ruizarguesonis]TBA94383.1 MmgE/PrpD family protein [Rhizobium ruizarguesonis]
MTAAQSTGAMRAVAIAEWVVSVTEISAKVRESAVLVILDALACSVAGLDVAGSVAARAVATELWGTGASSIWFTGARVSPHAAAFANSMATCILDYDDGHRMAEGHLGAAMVPAVFAEAQATGANAERVLTAIAIGYEVATRIAKSRDPKTVLTGASGRWCGQGVAAAVGWLRQYDAMTIANAMALTDTIAPYAMATEDTLVGNHVKEAIPDGTKNGLEKLAAARKGMLGPIDFLDRDRFDGNILARNLSDGWYIETTYFKPYSCCRWIHAPLDALLEQRDSVKDWDAVKEIIVGTFERTLTLNNQKKPKTLQSAQYSVPFCIASAAIYGAGCLQPMKPELLTDARVLTLADKVFVKVDADLEAVYPNETSGRVSIIMANEPSPAPVYVEIAKGDSRNPMTYEERVQKLQRCGEGVVDPSILASVGDAIIALRDQGQIEPLLNCLATSR